MRGLFVKFAVLTLLATPLPTDAATARMPVAVIGDNKVKLEVASTPEEITRGLMYRMSLPEDHGMVFLFHPASKVAFWMAHCFIKLDMLMIKDGKIIKIFENVPPCREQNTENCPTYPARNESPLEVTEVVEVIGGYSKRHNVHEGDTVKFLLPNGKPAFENKELPAKSK